MKTGFPETNKKRIIEVASRPAAYAAIWLVLITVCTFISGCRDSEVIWSAESRSPDGFWVAAAKEERGGGLGNAYDSVSVYLRPTKGSDPGVEVLQFSVGSHQSQSGKLDLTMNWETPAHLGVTYNGHAATLEFHIAKTSGVDISVQDRSNLVN
jgi:hypothetical protein